MLDWRGLLGTALVHAVAAGAWPASILGPTTYCLCRSWDMEEPVLFEHVRPNRLTLFPSPSGGDRQLALSVRRNCAGERPDASLPVMIGDPVVPPALAGTPFSACATIDARGRVTVLRIKGAEDVAPARLNQLRRTVKQLRFVPAKIGGVAVTAEIEIGLTS